MVIIVGVELKNARDSNPNPKTSNGTKQIRESPILKLLYQ